MKSDEGHLKNFETGRKTYDVRDQLKILENDQSYDRKGPVHHQRIKQKRVRLILKDFVVSQKSNSLACPLRRRRFGYQESKKLMRMQFKPHSLLKMMEFHVRVQRFGRTMLPIAIPPTRIIRATMVLVRSRSFISAKTNLKQLWPKSP